MTNSKLDRAKSLFLKARDQYYNEGNTDLTDSEFDQLEDYLKLNAPDWKPLTDTGSKVGKKSARVLEFPMASLDKIQSSSEDKLCDWCADHPSRLVMCKFDGSSIQATYIKGQLSSLATRGDGSTGKDISHFIPWVKNLPLKLTTKTKLVVRLEAILPKSIYQKLYESEFDSARALASSVFNRQDLTTMLRHIHFVALRDMGSTLPIVDQLTALGEQGFLTAMDFPYRVSNKALLAHKLESFLANARESCDYELDGLVLFSNEDQLPAPTADRPAYAKAFKVNDLDSAQTTVIEDIVWRISSFGVVVPKAIISPVKFGSVTVKQAALHNVKWAKTQGIGIGATVKILRSGDIIPKIVGVVKPSKFKLPTPASLGVDKIFWDKTQTNLMVDVENNVEVQAEKIARFFSKLGLDDLAKSISVRLVEHGISSTEELICKMGERQAWESIDRVKSSAAKFAKQIQRVHSGEFDLYKLMDASGCFDRGLGSTLLGLIPKSNLLGLPVEVTGLEDLEGFGPERVRLFNRGYPQFRAWMAATKLKVTWPKPTALIAGKLSGQNFSWTGYRSKAEEDKILSLGGSIVPFCARTTILFYDPSGKASSKIAKAGSRAKEFKKFLNC